ncbi:MAG: hypothetical protein GSR86_01880 [Desulfurococcales archaeon]|nr:hypothetical protein [Desulfurococcales archaeon]
MEKIGIPLLFITVLLVSMAYTVYSQPSEDEAKEIFTSIGCISCHSGKPMQPAASWDLIIQFMEEWSKKYPTIDDAVRNEVTYYGGVKFNDFNELITQMARNVGKDPSDPEIQQLVAFFKSYWGEKATVETTTEEKTIEETTETVMEATEEAKTDTGVKGGVEPKEGITLTVIGIILIIIISIAAAIYLTRR